MNQPPARGVGISGSNGVVSLDHSLPSWIQITKMDHPLQWKMIEDLE